QRFQPRVETEEPVEIERAVFSVGRPGNRDAGPRLVVLGFAERHNDVQAVDGAALEDRDQPARPPRSIRGERGAREKRRREAEAHEGEGAVLEKHSPGQHGHFLWKSGPPSASARSLSLRARRSAKFIRFTSAPVLTHASALSE